MKTCNIFKSFSIILVALFLISPSSVNAQGKYKKKMKEAIEDLNEAMDELKVEMENLDVKIEAELADLEINLDEINAEIERSMETAVVELRDELDYDGELEGDVFERFEMLMEKLNVKLEAELEKLGEFLDEFTDELVKDGYIENEDENYDMEIEKGVIYINDEPLKDEHQEKYRKIYEKYYDDFDKDDHNFGFHKHHD